MSVVVRSASISLNESSFKKRLSVDRPPAKTIATEPGPSPKSENTLKASVQEKTKPILVVVPKATSKRKPLKDITTKVCRTLSQSVASCQASPTVPDADFTIYVDALAQSRISKRDTSVQEKVVVPETDKTTTDQDTRSKENIPPILLLAKDKSEIPIEKSDKTPPRAKKQSSTLDKKQNTVDASVKRKRRQTMDIHTTTPKRASLRMMR